MSANLHFELPKALILNANQRMHWAPKAAIVRNLRAMGKIAARGCTPMDRAHLIVRVGWPDKRARDVDNISPTIKALVDGIVGDGGLLPGDDDAHLIGPDKRPYVAGKTGILVLDFEFHSVDPGPENARIAGRNSDPAVASTATGSTHSLNQQRAGFDE